MKTIALFEEAWTGHRPIFLKLFNQALLALGYQVITFCPQPQEVEDWIDTHCAPKAGQFQVFKFTRPPASQFAVKKAQRILNAVNLWQAARQALETVIQQQGKKPDMVFFCVLDGYLAPGLTQHVVDKLFPYTWSGHYFLPFHLRLNKTFWAALPALAQPHAALYSRYCPAVVINDEGVADELQQRLKGKKVVVFPDVIDVAEVEPDFPLLAQIKRKARGRKIVGLLGSQSRRKSLFTLVETAQTMASEDVFFVFGGPLYPKTFTAKEHSKLFEILSRNLENCFFYFDVLPETEMNALMSLCDIVFAAYEKSPHSSGTLIRAAALRKPVIVSKHYCMDERVRKFNLGISVNEGNVTECIDALRYLAQHPLENPDFKGYQALHSASHFPAAFKQLMDALE